MSISVIILSFNSEKVLRKTIQSAKSVSDDIHVVDSYSEDKTLEIAHELGAKVVQHEFVDYGKQRNWAISELQTKYDWHLHLDADEHLSEQLSREINNLKQSFPENINGYMIPRLTVFLGKELRHGGLYPIWHLRLFRKAEGRCESRRYDQHFYVNGKTEKLNAPLIDDQQMSIAEWTSSHNRWSDAEVEEILSNSSNGGIEPKLSGSPIEQKRALRGWYYKAPLFLRAFLLFLYRYIIRLGFLDGKEGLIYLFLQSFWYRFIIDAKVYERKLYSSL